MNILILILVSTALIAIVAYSFFRKTTVSVEIVKRELEPLFSEVERVEEKAPLYPSMERDYTVYLNESSGGILLKFNKHPETYTGTSVYHGFFKNPKNSEIIILQKDDTVEKIFINRLDFGWVLVKNFPKIHLEELYSGGYQRGNIFCFKGNGGSTFIVLKKSDCTPYAYNGGLEVSVVKRTDIEHPLYINQFLGDNLRYYRNTVNMLHTTEDGELISRLDGWEICDDVAFEGEGLLLSINTPLTNTIRYRIAKGDNLKDLIYTFPGKISHPIKISEKYYLIIPYGGDEQYILDIENIYLGKIEDHTGKVCDGKFIAQNGKEFELLEAIPHICEIVAR